MTSEMVANLNYNFRADGVAEIYGIRVKPQYVDLHNQYYVNFRETKLCLKRSRYFYYL